MRKSWSRKPRQILRAGAGSGYFAAGLKRKESQGKAVPQRRWRVILTPSVRSFAVGIVDECHRIGDDEDSQYQQILTHLSKVNPHLRLLGLTATPFLRLEKAGFINFIGHGMVRGNDNALFRDWGAYELPLVHI